MIAKHRDGHFNYVGVNCDTRVVSYRYLQSQRANVLWSFAFRATLTAYRPRPRYAQVSIERQKTDGKKVFGETLDPGCPLTLTDCGDSIPTPLAVEILGQ